MSSPPRRRRPRPIVPGKTAEITWTEYGELLAARGQLEQAKLRLRRVTARLERAIGDAELATVDGTAVLWREQQRTGGHYIGVSYRDDLRPLPARAWECPRCHCLFQQPGFNHEPCSNGPALEVVR